MGIKSDADRWNYLKSIYENEKSLAESAIKSWDYNITEPNGTRHKDDYWFMGNQECRNLFIEYWQICRKIYDDWIFGIHGHIEETIDYPFATALTDISYKVINLNFLDITRNCEPALFDAVNFFDINLNSEFKRLRASVNTDTNSDIVDDISEINYWNEQFDDADIIEEKVRTISMDRNVRTDQDWQYMAREFAKWLYKELYKMPWPGDEWFDEWFFLSDDPEDFESGAVGDTCHDPNTHIVNYVKISIVGHENWDRDDWIDRFMTIVHEMRHVYQHMSYSGQLSDPDTPINDASTAKPYFEQDVESDAYTHTELCTP